MFYKRLVLILAMSSFAYAAKENSDERVEKKRSEFFFVLENALKNNKEIVAAQKNLMATHENHVMYASPFKPNIALESRFSTNKRESWNGGDKNGSFETNTTGGSNWPNTKSYGVSISQNLFNGGADVAALKETDLNIKAQWSEYEATKQKVLREVAELYFNIIAKKQEIAHIKTLLDSRKSIVELSTQMHATGSVKFLDVAQSQADLATTEGKLSTAEAEFESLCAQFEEKTGIIVPETLSVPDKLFETSLTIKQASDIALKQNPSIIAAADKLHAAKEAVKKPNPSFRPSLDIACKYDQSLQKINDRTHDPKDSTRQTTVELTFKIPLYDGGTGRAQKRQAIEKANQIATEKEKLIQETKTGVVSTLAAIEAAKENLASSRKAVEANELAYNDTKEEFKAGLKITKDVLDAQQKLFEAKFVETQAYKQYFISQCSANALLGRLNAKYLKIKDSEFNYKKHFEHTTGKL